ncbi:UNVERIFIED_CONTAM: hypothetical protein Sangu_3175300 [Sesamum angustifolium]|uniref:Uncharacterized protein n=1 Tax=Sesamum angustifolium TaxID=2727405 RepID=A0AAW2JTR0_9LAMI
MRLDQDQNQIEETHLDHGQVEETHLHQGRACLDQHSIEADCLDRLDWIEGCLNQDQVEETRLNLGLASIRSSVPQPRPSQGNMP